MTILPGDTVDDVIEHVRTTVNDSNVTVRQVGSESSGPSLVSNIKAALAENAAMRQGHWSESIAVGSKGVAEDVKQKLGLAAKHREVMHEDTSNLLRETLARYNGDFSAEKMPLSLITPFPGTQITNGQMLSVVRPVNPAGNPAEMFPHGRCRLRISYAALMRGSIAFKSSPSACCAMSNS